MTDLDPRYWKGVEHFNKREYYDAHEIWEELWHEEHGEAHDFVQGLIQFATALHHFEDSNLKGTRLLYIGGQQLLAPYPEIYWGIQLGKLRSDMERAAGKLVAYEQDKLPGRYNEEKKKFPIQLEESLIPRIEKGG